MTLKPCFHPDIHFKSEIRREEMLTFLHNLLYDNGCEGIPQKTARQICTTDSNEQNNELSSIAVLTVCHHILVMLYQQITTQIN